MITVANIRDLPPVSEWPEHYVYIGRANPRKGLKESYLANPYKVGQWDTLFPPHQMNLEDVILRYNYWLHLAPAMGKTFELSRLSRLLAKHDQLTLVCFCAPKPCHGDVIKEYLEAHHA